MMASLERHSLPAYEHIKALDREQSRCIQALHRSKARWDFFKAMEKDPVGFTRRWVASQKRDLEVIMGETGRSTAVEQEAFAEVWESDVVKEAVRYFMNKPA